MVKYRAGFCRPGLLEYIQAEYIQAEYIQAEYTQDRRQYQ